MVDKVMIFFLGLLTGAIILGVTYDIFNQKYPDGYRAGQIDCLNGKIYYELRPQHDGTTAWINVPEGVQ